MRLLNSNISTSKAASNEFNRQQLWQELSDLESQTVQGGSSQDDDDDKYLHEIEIPKHKSLVWYYEDRTPMTDAKAAAIAAALSVEHDVQPLP
ncbi:MAG: hypothetical protein AAGE59_14955 [Cyanobacteria bacterium P01_F01_bin.86]